MLARLRAANAAKKRGNEASGNAKSSEVMQGYYPITENKNISTSYGENQRKTENLEVHT